jgi:hypothetical protein
LLRDKSGHNILFEAVLAVGHHIRETEPARSFTALEIQYLFDSLNDALKSENAARISFTHLLGGAEETRRFAGILENRVQHDYPDSTAGCAEHLWRWG